MHPENTREAAYDALMQRVREAHRSAVADDNANDAQWLRLGREAVASPKPRPSRWTSMLLPVGLAAAAAVSLLVVAVGDKPIDARVGPWQLATQATEHMVEVVGGHRVTVAPDSIVAVTTNDGDHFVARVERGSAYFDVQPRTHGQSFEVLVGDHRVTVRGTAFRVVRGADTTGDAVVVDHGRVAVDGAGVSVVLGAGEGWQASNASDTVSTQAGANVVAPPIAPAEKAAERVEAPSREVAVPLGAKNAKVAAPLIDAGMDAAASSVDAAANVNENASDNDENQARTQVGTPATSPLPKPSRTAQKTTDTPKRVVVATPEPLSSAARDALLGAMRRGDCGRVEKALAAIITSHGKATPAEVLWMKAWCLRKRGDVAGSRSMFDRVAGRVGWPLPAGDELPPLPR